MSTLLDLTEWLEVDTPQGRGYAIIFESDNDENFWTVILNETQAIVTFKQKYVKASRNYTWGRAFPDEEMAKTLAATKKKHEEILFDLEMKYNQDLKK